MAVYEYLAKNPAGKEFSGTYKDIQSTAVLRDELSKAGYELVKARRITAKKDAPKRVKRREVIAFTYKFAGMYAAGLSVINSLESLEEQTENKALKEVIGDIRRNVETGSSLRKSFDKYSDIFSDFFLGMVEAGEASGRLATALELSAEYLENQADLRQKVKSAFIYPMAVGIVCLIVVTCLLIFVVPMFSKLYKRLHVTLPGPTQALVILSYLIRHWWWVIIPFSIGCVLGIKKLFANEKVREKWDNFKLHIPVFGRLNRMVVVSHFTRTFSLLISVGVPIIDAFGVANEVAHNKRMSQIAQELQKSIKGGHPVAQSLKEYDIFPPTLVQLAAAGEEAGVLPEMLNKAVDFLDKDIERAIGSLLVKLEPALTLIMGTIIGLILMGVYLPMFDYMAKIH
jgi:type IV pilus assembly protein PilC